MSKYIEGPVSLTEHILDDKHIYIFGDEHLFREGCQEKNGTIIDKFLQQTLIDNKDKMIDIFLEVPYLSKDSPIKVYEYRKEAGYLFQNVITTFTNCLQVAKSTCPYKNSRFHYIDIRFINLDDFIDLQYLTEKLIDVGTLIENFWDSNLTKKEAKLCINRIKEKLKKFNPDNVNFNINNILENTKLQKQIESVKDKEIRNKLREKLDELEKEQDYVNKGKEILVGIKEEFMDEEKVSKFLKEDKFEDLYEKIDKIDEKLSEFHSGFMDIFLLARLFRTFKDSSEPKNIIIYTGNDHSNFYRKFLSDLNFKEINRVENENQCLDVSDFKIPFFQ